MGVEITFKPEGNKRFGSALKTAKGYRLAVRGDLDQPEPQVTGADHLAANRSLVHNLWAYTKYEKRRRRARDDAKRKAFAKHARGHREAAEGIAALLDYGAGSRKVAWCSSCFARSEHMEILVPQGTLDSYLCVDCGSPTLTCFAPGCQNMATRGTGKFGIRRYCAEHRHEIPGFAKAEETIESLDDWADLFTYEKRNLAAGAKKSMVGLLGVGALATGGLLAAPALGGAVGVLVGGYSGAAATSYGLALLGGGSVAAGGLGMVGGTAVVTVAGGSLGGALGLAVADAYVGTDKSFRIEKLRGGTGDPVVLANGFTSDKRDTWPRWKDLLDPRFADAPVYRVHWGAKELRDLAVFAGGRAGFEGGVRGVVKVAGRAAKAARGLVAPVQAAVAAADVAKNPWHTAKNRADMTGVVLASILTRVAGGQFILVGHSLGARVMVRAAQALGMRGGVPRIAEMHVLGAAVGARENWTTLESSVTGEIHGYRSTRDPVLRWLYTIAQLGSEPAGRRGFIGATTQVVDHDLSRRVKNHGDYFEAVRLQPRPEAAPQDQAQSL